MHFVCEFEIVQYIPLFVVCLGFAADDVWWSQAPEDGHINVRNMLSK